MFVRESLKSPCSLRCAALAMVAAAMACFGFWKAMAQDAEPTAEQASQQTQQQLTNLLDSSLSNQARAQAGRQLGYLENDEDVDRLVAMLQNADLPESLRMIALAKIGESRQERAVELALEMLQDEGAGDNLRVAAAKLLRVQAQFGAARDPAAKQAIAEAFYELLNSDEPMRLRLAGLSYLSITGDDRATEIIKTALRNPEAGLVDQVYAVGYATADDPQKYLEELAAILDKPASPQAAARVVEALASNPNYQQRILNAMKDDAAPLEVRLAAVETLPQYYPAALADVAQIAESGAAPPALRAASLYEISGAVGQYAENPERLTSAGIDLERLNKTAMDLVQDGSLPEQVRGAARAYLQANAPERGVANFDRAILINDNTNQNLLFGSPDWTITQLLMTDFVRSNEFVKLAPARTENADVEAFASALADQYAVAMADLQSVRQSLRAPIFDRQSSLLELEQDAARDYLERLHRRLDKVNPPQFDLQFLRGLINDQVALRAKLEIARRAESSELTGFVSRQIEAVDRNLDTAQALEQRLSQ